MHVERLLLKNFRNYESLSLEFGNEINLFFGDNAQGKTNILEALYLCATGRSQRTHYDKELIRFKEAEAFVQAFRKDEYKIEEKISIHIKSNSKKGIAINNIPIKKSGDLFGVLLTVIFSPEDLQLVKSGPAERRRYMDIELCQLNKVYYYELQQYYKILKQRNALLKKIQYQKNQEEFLSVWDSQLIQTGIKIIQLRQEFIEKINELAGRVHSIITNQSERLVIAYKPNVSEKDFPIKLEKNKERDIQSGSTNAGIHKDDLEFMINGFDTRIFGSQGQQRSASLSAKLAEIELIKVERNQTPVLLLDDVFSELDEKRQKFLLKSTEGIQTMITCTGLDSSFVHLKGLCQNVSIFNVNLGVVKNVTRI